MQINNWWQAICLIIILNDNKALSYKEIEENYFKYNFQEIHHTKTKFHAKLIGDIIYYRTVNIEPKRIFNPRIFKRINSPGDSSNFKIQLVENWIDIIKETSSNHSLNNLNQLFIKFNLPINFTINQPRHNIQQLIDEFYNDVTKSGYIFRKQFIKRFIVSLLTRRFVIFTGLSGSGKTILAKLFATWIGSVFDGDQHQSLLLPVGADWTSNENIIGYPNALDHERYESTNTLELILEALKDPGSPYFLILDEMNLSQVEKYFSDVLSAIESDGAIPLHSNQMNGDYTEIQNIPNKIFLPKNLFIIGTVNIDETTYMFSPKVLDRANVIEFKVDKESIEKLLTTKQNVENLDSLSNKGVQYSYLLLEDYSRLIIPMEGFSDHLLELFELQSASNLEFGYRTVNDMIEFIKIWKNSTSDDDFSLYEVLDILIYQKVLPKLHGSRNIIEPVLVNLAYFCYH
jgi:5-methylcytosine-specific restriction enzyme B